MDQVDRQLFPPFAYPASVDFSFRRTFWGRELALLKVGVFPPPGCVKSLHAKNQFDESLIDSA